MKNFIVNISLILALISGQLIKIPLFTHGGIILLDFIVILMDIYGSFRLKLKFRKFPLWIFWATIFIFISVISLALTHLDLTWQEYYTSFSYTIRFSLYIFLGWLIYRGALPAIEEKIPQILTLSGFFLSILGLLQLLTLPDLIFLSNYGWDPHYFRVVSTFLDPNFLGAFLTLTLIVIIQNSKVAKKLKILSFIIIYIALLGTFSRGAYIGFGAGLIVLSILNKSFRLFILTALLFFILLLSFSFYQKFVAQPRNIDRAQSAEFRLTAWQQGIALFQKNPIFGVGFNTYRYALKEFKMGNDQFLNSHGASSNDSSFLFVLATTGVLGFTAYSFFLFSLIWLGFNNFLQKNLYGITLLAGLATLIIQSFFSNTLFYPPLFLWLVLIASQNKSSQ